MNWSSMTRGWTAKVECKRREEVRDFIFIWRTKLGRERERNWSVGDKNYPSHVTNKQLQLALLPDCLSACLSVCLSVSLTVFLSTGPLLCLFVYLPDSPPVCLDFLFSLLIHVCASSCVYLTLCLSICLSVCLSIFFHVWLFLLLKVCSPYIV